MVVSHHTQAAGAMVAFRNLIEFKAGEDLSQLGAEEGVRLASDEEVLSLVVGAWASRREITEELTLKADAAIRRWAAGGKG